jgi:sulfur carrier protein
VIQITVNGAAQRYEQPPDLLAVLEKMQVAGKKVAVERNGEIVPRSLHRQTLLQDGDQLEIVVAVGGG